jgi:hypothetical protein
LFSSTIPKFIVLLSIILKMREIIGSCLFHNSSLKTNKNLKMVASSPYPSLSCLPSGSYRKEEMGRTCGMYGEKWKQVLVGNLKQRN